MYNKVVCIGNLTRDIELKYLPNNTALAKGAIATSHKYKMQSGEQKEEVCFLDFTMFGKLGEIANQYLHKGSKVMLEGRLQFDQWDDAQTGAKRNKHSLMVSEMKMLDSKGSSTNTPPVYQPQETPVMQQAPNNRNNVPNTPTQHMEDIPTIDIDNDEIPF